MFVTTRVDDPDEHYPYKYDHVAALVAEDGPAGPSGPDDDRARISDYMSHDIASASGLYVDAQEAYLTEPGDATLAAYRDAKQALLDARRAHRVNRGDGVTIVANRAG